MQRRRFLRGALGAVALRALGGGVSLHAAEPRADAPVFSTGNAGWQAAYDKALAVLAGNVQTLPEVKGPVLFEGSTYAGIWQECGPHEALVYRRFRPDVARNSHLAFFALQHESGQIPANIKRTGPGFAQIQMVVPIAATAWELASATGDGELLEKAYASCSRWDAWLRRYRNTRGTGLVEGFCTYDTGMDNSPRWAGMPVRCPGGDAARCPEAEGLPRLCPDLSATAFGARVALAQMASALGKREEAERWRTLSEELRRLILDRLYVAEEASFYDVDSRDQRVHVRCDILSRICGEHVVDQPTFERMWGRQLGDPAAFWTAFPLPSVAANDPAFVRPIPRNSWGGAAQALTALRAGRWMEFYGRHAEYSHLMTQWCEALQQDMSFRQQLDPLTGQFTQDDPGGYSPACLALVDFTWRLAGVREDGAELHWNVRPGLAVSSGAVFTLNTRNGTAEIRYSEHAARLTLRGRSIGEVRGTCRLITDTEGRGLALLGTDQARQRVAVKLPGRATRLVQLSPNQRVDLLD